MPYPGHSWECQGQPQRQPHEYIRNGTAKLLTLFRPANGQLRTKGVTSCTNAVLHGWLKQELSDILSALPTSHGTDPGSHPGDLGDLDGRANGLSDLASRTGRRTDALGSTLYIYKLITDRRKQVFDVFRADKSQVSRRRSCLKKALLPESPAHECQDVVEGGVRFRIPGGLRQR